MSHGTSMTPGTPEESAGQADARFAQGDGLAGRSQTLPVAGVELAQGVAEHHHAALGKVAQLCSAAGCSPGCASAGVPQSSTRWRRCRSWTGAGRRTGGIRPGRRRVVAHAVQRDERPRAERDPTPRYGRACPTTKATTSASPGRRRYRRETYTNRESTFLRRNLIPQPAQPFSAAVAPPRGVHHEIRLDVLRPVSAQQAHSRRLRRVRPGLRWRSARPPRSAHGSPRREGPRPGTADTLRAAVGSPSGHAVVRAPGGPAGRCCTSGRRFGSHGTAPAATRSACQPREEIFEGLAAPRQQTMRVTAPPRDGLTRQYVTVDHRDPIERLAEHPGRRGTRRCPLRRRRRAR